MTAGPTAHAPFFHGARQISFREHDYGEPGPGQLLLAVRANALCGTDRGFWTHGADHVPGHETAGVVIAAGPDTSTALGTLGVVFLMDFCGTCRSCRLGATNQCLAKRGDMGMNADGGYGPYELVHESIFFAVGDDLDPAEATMLLDVMGTSRHAIERAGLLRSDIESVHVAGAGPIGAGIVVMTRLLLGEVDIYVSDVSGWRRDFAERLGARAVDATDERALRQVPEVDVAFDSSGREVARRAALDRLAPRGVLVCVGHGETITLDVSADLIGPEHAVLGSEYFRYDELPANLALLRAHRDEISQVITHRMPIEEIGTAFELFMAGETGKVVLTQDGQP